LKKIYEAFYILNEFQWFFRMTFFHYLSLFDPKNHFEIHFDTIFHQKFFQNGHILSKCGSKCHF